MKSTSKRTKKQLTEANIDNLVESQTDDDSAWEKTIEVRRQRPASFSIPAQLAARAAFLANLHRERNVEDWIAKVIKERVELEEIAFSQVKREISLRNSLEQPQHRKGPERRPSGSTFCQPKLSVELSIP